MPLGLGKMEPMPLGSGETDHVPLGSGESKPSSEGLDEVVGIPLII
jgi:hypothetical protein